MKSPENRCIDVDEIILPSSKPQKFIGRLPTKKTSKQKMTTFWVSPGTWKHVQGQRELGETVDECLRRLMGIRRQVDEEEDLEIRVTLRGRPRSGKTYYLMKFVELLGRDGFDITTSAEEGETGERIDLLVAFRNSNYI